MNTFVKTLISGAVGTTFMTALSGLMSLLPKEEFFEPEQLSKMLKRIAPVLGKSTQQLSGWGAHYGMGMLFASVYVQLWHCRKLDDSNGAGLLLGGLSGLIGMMIWKATFSLHPIPPNNRKLDFYLQRIPAHVVFALFTTIAYRLIREKELRNRLHQNDRPTPSLLAQGDKF
jgi:hypothetical protein